MAGGRSKAEGRELSKAVVVRLWSGEGAERQPVPSLSTAAGSHGTVHRPPGVQGRSPGGGPGGSAPEADADIQISASANFAVRSDSVPHFFFRFRFAVDRRLAGAGVGF